MEKLEGVYLIVWSHVLELLPDEVRQLKYDHFKCFEMELVQNAEVNNGIPLFLELLICRVISQMHYLLNEICNINTFLCHDVFQVVPYFMV